MPNVLVEKKDRTTVVTLNRPERRNALTIELLTELTAAMDESAVGSRASASSSCAGPAKPSVPVSTCRKRP